MVWKKIQSKNQQRAITPKTKVAQDAIALAKSIDPHQPVHLAQAETFHYL